MDPAIEGKGDANGRSKVRALILGQQLWDVV
jgi:hypothetical protein